MSDVEAKIAHIESMRAVIGDVAADAAIAAVQAEANKQTTTTTVQSGRNQTIGGNAQVGVVVGNDVYGNIYLYGQRGKTNVELLHGYLTRLAKRYSVLPLQGVREQKAIDDVLAILLEQVYTQLRTTDSYLVTQAIAEPGHYTQSRRTSTKERLDAFTHLVLLGEPGSGKSTALSYIALTLAEAGLDEHVNLGTRLEGWDTLGEKGKLLPIFLPLLPLAKRLAKEPGKAGSDEDVWNEIARHVEMNGAYPGLAPAVRDELEEGRVLLMLDGLDEVAGAESRRRVIRAVRDFAQQHTNCRIVVACRVRAYEGEQNAEWQLPGWPTATLADWTLGQMNYFIDAWYHAAAVANTIPLAKRDERIAGLKRALKVREDLRKLGVRPLLLTIMALVHLNYGSLPEDRVSLYSRCIDILLSQWETRGKDETEYGALMDYIKLPETDVKALRPMLTRAAYVAHEASDGKNLGRIERNSLRVIVADGLETLKQGNPHEGAKLFLEYTDVRAGLLQASDAGDAYVFPHQTFQEYLAGLELVSDVKFVQRVMEKRADDRWRVPIFLGLGHTVSEGVLAAPHQLLSRLLHATGAGKSCQKRRTS